jgi:hypothetical protein
VNEDKSIPYDAQQIAEEIESGDRQSTKVNTDKDYEKAQEYATSSPDSENNSDPQELKASGNPKQFREMAREVTNSENS